MRTPLLSKSKYLAGLQCPRRLWLAAHARDLAAQPSAAELALQAAGSEVGEHARRLFPGGVVVAEEARQHAQALRRTRALLTDARVPAVFEAAFEHAGVRIRVDVLERLPGGRFGLREVKAATSVKDHHVDDLAIQRFVLEGSGLQVGSVELVYVNGDYARGAHGMDWQRFFRRQDCARPVARRLRELRANVERFHAVLAQRAAPEVEPGPHCHSPFGCEFWGHCTREKPADWIHHLPRLRARRLAELRSAGHERIALLPDDAPLTALQRRVRDTVRAGRPFVSRALAAALRPLEPPAWYLDFETLAPAVPLYPGTRPYEPVPFQWSLRRLRPGGRPTERGFLARGVGDPRPRLAEALVSTLRGDEAPIAVYSSYEQVQIAGLMESVPALSDELYAISKRLVDLLDVVRQHVYHPAFGGSFSIKSVAPALVPALGYGDLEVADGAAASAHFLRIARGDLARDEEARVRQALRAYCARDTLALVEVHRALRRLAAGEQGWRTRRGQG
jgi:predicted RecB family nuclease